MKIKLIRIHRFGRTDIKPACENSKLLLKLARNRSSFQISDIEIIAKLGYEIDYVTDV